MIVPPAVPVEGAGETVFRPLNDDGEPVRSTCPINCGNGGREQPEAMVVLAVGIEIVAGVLIIVGWRARWAAWLLILYVLIATAMAHRFWEFPEAQQFNQLNHFLKNFAIIGGLLYIISFGPGRMSILDEPYR